MGLRMLRLEGAPVTPKVIPLGKQRLDWSSVFPGIVRQAEVLWFRWSGHNIVLPCMALTRSSEDHPTAVS